MILAYTDMADKLLHTHVVKSFDLISLDVYLIIYIPVISKEVTESFGVNYIDTLNNQIFKEDMLFICYS